MSIIPFKRGTLRSHLVSAMNEANKIKNILHSDKDLSLIKEHANAMRKQISESVVFLSRVRKDAEDIAKERRKNNMNAELVEMLVSDYAVINAHLTSKIPGIYRLVPGLLRNKKRDMAAEQFANIVICLARCINVVEGNILPNLKKDRKYVFESCRKTNNPYCSEALTRNKIQIKLVA